MRMQNGETLAMAKDKPTNTSIPLITDPPKPTEPRDPLFGTKIEPAPTPIPHIDFDADASESPDTAQSHMAEPTTDVVHPTAVLTGEPPHWTEIPAQMKQYRDFVMGQINDYGLFDRDEKQSLIDWTMEEFLDHHKIVLTEFATFGEARAAIAPKFVDAFKNDLKQIAFEKEFPINTQGDLYKLVGYYTIEEALQKMTGKGIRAAICGKLAAIESERHVAQVNGTAQREQPALEPVKQDVIIETPKSEPKTTEQRSLTVQRNRVPSAPPEHSLSVNWQMSPLQIAQFAVQSGLYKGIDSEAKAMMVMLRGLSLQIDPLMALEQINIIEGKTAVSSALMHALVERSGQLEDIKIVETDLQCTVTLTRTDRTPVSVTYSNEDAIRAGLVNKYNWKSMPKLMRYHRAFAIAARRCFSDVLLFGGAIYTNEELQPDRNVNEDGDFVTVTTAA
jgi:hypothetical protein